MSALGRSRQGVERRPSLRLWYDTSRSATGWGGTASATGGVGASMEPAGALSVRATEGAMICFWTSPEPQTGHVKSPCVRCASKASLEGNQLSNGWALLQARA